MATVAAPSRNGHGSAGALVPTNRVKPTDLTRELGTSGLKQYGGRVQEEFLWQLRDRKGMETYREMRENDPVVNAFFQAIIMQMRGVGWQATGAEGPDADAANEYAESLRHDMSQTWEDTISEVAETMLTYGWAFLEIVYKTRQGPNPEDGARDSAFEDNRMGWRKLQPVAPETLKNWVFDESDGPERGSLLGLRQLGSMYGTQRIEDPFIPMEKALLFRTVTRKKNPEGRSILRGAYRPWFFKKRMEEIEGIGIERDLAGYPVIQPKSNADGQAAFDLWDGSARSNDYLRWMNQLVRGVRRDELEGAVIPGNMDLKLLSTGGDRQLDVSAVIERYDRRIATVALADVILIGHENVGSYALADSKTNLLAVSLGAWMKMIAAVFNRYALPRLFRMSALRLTKLPEFLPGDIETLDPTIMADFLQKMVAIGAINLGPDDEVWARNLGGLPERTVEEIEEEEEERERQAEEIASGAAGDSSAGEDEEDPSDSSSNGQVEDSDEEESRGRKAGQGATAR